MTYIHLETGEQIVEALILGDISREDAIRGIAFLEDITEEMAGEILTELEL